MRTPEESRTTPMRRRGGTEHPAERLRTAETIRKKSKHTERARLSTSLSRSLSLCGDCLPSSPSPLRLRACERGVPIRAIRSGSGKRSPVGCAELTTKQAAKRTSEIGKFRTVLPCRAMPSPYCPLYWRRRRRRRRRRGRRQLTDETRRPINLL